MIKQRPAIGLTLDLKFSICVYLCSSVVPFSIGGQMLRRAAMIGGAVASEQDLAQMGATRARLARPSAPRTIHMSADEADRLGAASVPIHYVTETIRSTETGAPTALMELAYRLAVDESPYVK